MHSEEVIFVDCFNTVLKRNVKSKEVFIEWTKKLSSKYNINSEIIYTLYKKITFHNTLKSIVYEKNIIADFNSVLEDLFNKLHNNNLNIDKLEFLNDAKDFYRDCECEVLYPNLEIIKMIKAKKSEGKKIFIVSDFNCNSNFIKSLLADKGLLNLFDNVYSSCDYKMEKATGKLYKKIMQDNKLKKNQITMYGDNIMSDVVMAKKNGLKANRVGKNYKYKSNTIINDEWDEIFNLDIQDFNYSNHAFPLFLFTERLYNSLIADKSKDILFMSREGQFLKRLFDRYIEIRKELGINELDINSHYFYGSRNSIMKASVKELENEDFDFLFRFFFFMTARSFMISIGFSDEQIEEIKNNIGINIDKMSLNFKSSKLFKELKNNAKFKEIYDNNRKSQAEVLKHYIDTFKIDTKTDKLVFVDIGYHGTMQDLIFKYLSGNVKMKGYFVKSRAISTEDNMKVGLLSDNNNKNLFGHTINKYDAFNYEQILRADHGRCLGYTMSDGIAKPIIDSELYDVEVYNKLVKELQEKIFKKFELIAYKSLREKIDCSKICVAYYYFMVKNKSDKDYTWILDMQDSHHDDFGIVGYSGKMIGRTIRKIAFKLNDFQFIKTKKNYIKKLIKDI